MVQVVTGHMAIARGHMTTPEIARTIIDVMAQLHRAIGGHHNHSSHLNKTDIRDERHAIVRMKRGHSSVTRINVERQMLGEITGQIPPDHMKAVLQESQGKMLIAPHMRSVLKAITNILAIKMIATMPPTLQRDPSVVHVTVAMSRTNPPKNGM